MSRVLVVARREILQALGQRSILISTGFSIAILAGIILLPDLLGFGGPAQQTVAVSGPEGTRLVERARAAQDAFGIELVTREAASDAEARALVSGDGADVAVLGGGERIVAGAGAADATIGALQAAVQRAEALAALERAGVGEEVARAVLDPPPAPVDELEGDNAQGLAFVALFVLYGQLLGYGFVVASGIVEEKSSRVVELLVSVLRPRELLAGKVLGIGVVGLVQLLVIAAAGLLLGVISGAVELDGPAWRALGVVLLWFLLGYAFFSAAFAVAGALVPRQEDLQTVTTPVTIVMVAVFVLSFPAIEDPSGSLARTLSLLPFSAPLVMPVRLIAGDVAVWEVLAAIASTVAGTLLLVALAGRVYRAAALETRSAISLRAALRRG